MSGEKMPYECLETSITSVELLTARKIILHQNGELNLEEDRLSMLLDELKPYGQNLEEVRDYFRKHLEECSGCKKEYQQIGELTTILNFLQGVEIPNKEQFVKEVISRIHKK